MSTTTGYPVEGLTCGHCAAAITEEVSGLAGVERVEVDLVPGGVSTLHVTADQDLSHRELAAAIEEAGDYRLRSN